MRENRDGASGANFVSSRERASCPPYIVSMYRATDVQASPGLGLTVFATASVSLIAVLFLTNWPTYHYTVRGGPLALYYYLVPSVLIVPLLCAEPRLAVKFLKEPLFWWFVIYVLSGLLWLLLAQDFQEDADHQWRLRLVAFSFFYTITIFTATARRSWVGLVILACVALACALNWFDVLRPERIVPKGVIVGIDQAGSGRGAGTFIDANSGAAFIVMGTIAALPFVPRSLRGLLFVAAIIGVAPAYSRSGYVLVAVAALGAIGLRLLSWRQGIALIVGIPLLAAAIGLSYDFLLEHTENKNLHLVMQRLSWFEDHDIEDAAVEGRKYGATVAWNMFLENPLLGRGTGATSREVLMEEPHNVYLALMAEQGIFGLALYVSLVGILARRGWRLYRTAVSRHGQEAGQVMVLFAFFLATYGVFIHNVLKEPYTLFVLAFIVAMGFEAARLERHHIATHMAYRGRIAGTGAAL